MESVLSIIVDIGLGAAALATARGAMALATAAKEVNARQDARADAQDSRIDKLVRVSEAHETRLERLEKAA